MSNFKGSHLKTIQARNYIQILINKIAYTHPSAQDVLAVEQATMLYVKWPGLLNNFCHVENFPVNRNPLGDENKR